MLCSIISTRWIAFCVISLVSESLGDLTLFQGPRLTHTSGTNERHYFCITEDDGAALVLNTDFPLSPKSKSHKQNTFTVQDRYIEFHTYLPREMTSGTWELVTSEVHPMGPVYDYRWEGFEPQLIGSENPVYIRLRQNITKVVFSARGRGEIAFPSRHRAKSNATQLSEYQWQTFIGEWYKNNVTIKNLVNSKVVSGSVDRDNRNDSSLYSSSPGLIRLHLYDYYRTTTNGTVLRTNFFYINKFICVDIPVSLCLECELIINVKSGPSTSTKKLGKISGHDNKPVSDELPTWRYEKLTLNMDDPGWQWVSLEIVSNLVKHVQRPLWAVDRFRTCKSPDDVKESKIIVSSDTDQPNVTCQKLSYTERLSVKVDDGNSCKIPTDLGKCLCSQRTPTYRYLQKYVTSGTVIYGSCASESADTPWRSDPEKVGFKNGEVPKLLGRDGAFIRLEIPAVVNPPLNTKVKIVLIVRRPSPCVVNQPLPHELKKLVNMSDSETGWVAGTELPTENEPNLVMISLVSINGCNWPCPLPPKDPYVVVVVLAVNEINVLAITAVNIPEETNSPAFLIVTFLLLIIVLCVLLYVYRRKLLKAVRQARHVDLALHLQTFMNFVKSIRTGASGNPQSLAISNDTEELCEIMSTPAPDESIDNLQSISIRDFEDYVKGALADGSLNSQFKMLPRGLNKPHTVGSLPNNKNKNRYANILPYDKTRVILEKTLGDLHSDYINANYVQGIGKEKAYIATQGPKPETVVDFWRMIWQEETLVICMLANLHENYKVKCEQYWPEYGATNTYGEIVVLTASHQAFAEYTIRSFRVSCRKETRKIHHLHYHGWPDHSVPMYTNSMISYLKKLLTVASGTGPIVMHCSAGIGRTGTIILCHICLRQAATNGTVDVFAEFKKLRDCRMNMVDNVLQYIFAHVILAECLVSLPTHLPCDKNLPQAIEKLKEKVPQHMERLCNTSWKDEALQNSWGLPRPTLPGQLEKNRFPELAPDSFSMIYLQRYPTYDNDSDYISAVMVDGLRQKKQYLASQLPLPSTLSDFWRLIAEQRIELVVILQRPDPNDPSCCEIFPNAKPFNPVPFIQVELKTKSEPEETLQIDELLLTDTSLETARTQRVNVLTCTKWVPGRGGEPPAPQELVQLWIDSENVHREKGPTLVLCHDGVTGCGLYLAMSFVLERMAVEHECDIIFAIRAIRRSRKDFVQTQERVKYLYDAAAEYVECFTDYANFD